MSASNAKAIEPSSKPGNVDGVAGRRDWRGGGGGGSQLAFEVGTGVGLRAVSGVVVIVGAGTGGTGARATCDADDDGGGTGGRFSCDADVEDGGGMGGRRSCEDDVGAGIFGDDGGTGGAGFTAPASADAGTRPTEPGRLLDGSSVSGVSPVEPDVELKGHLWHPTAIVCLPLQHTKEAALVSGATTQDRSALRIASVGTSVRHTVPHDAHERQGV